MCFVVVLILIIFDFVYTDILVRKLSSTDSAQDTDYTGIFFCRKFYKTSEENPKNCENF